MASLRLAKFSSPQQSTKAPSPLAGEGCGALASVSELRRSWMRGGAPSGARARKSANELAVIQFDSARALRAYRRGPLTQLRLSSLALAKPTHPSPARGEGTTLEASIVPQLKNCASVANSRLAPA